MATVKISMLPDVKEFYLSLPQHCAAEFDPGVARWTEGEVGRIVALLALDPTNGFLQRHRVLTGNYPYFVVVIPTPTGVINDVAVSWTFRTDGNPVVLDIDLRYAL